MNPIRPFALAVLLACCAATPAAARVSPYVRADFSGTGLRMTTGNQNIEDSQAALRQAGLPADFKPIGAAYGPGLSAGAWLFPCLRVGATYAYHKAVLANRLDVPGTIVYAHDLDLRVREIGGEAAVRFRRLAGLTFGASVAQGRGQLIEGLTTELPGSGSYFAATAQRVRPTYGGYVGIDQTNAAGVAGYVRIGFQYRDMSYMPSAYSLSDGVTTTTGRSNTIWLDYSGFYVNVGVGYDHVR